MTAQRIDGRAVADAMNAETASRAAVLTERIGRPPALAVLLVGDDPASHVYVRNKLATSAALGLRSLETRLAADATEAEVLAVVERWNADPSVDGVLVQLPLPPHIDAARVIGAIDPGKDVDGLTETSAGRLALGRPGLRPCTPSGCVTLAKTVHADLTGAHVVVLGRSILVGKPAAALFLAEDCTVTTAHSKTRDLPALCRTADILVPAVGRPEFVRGDWIKPGATVIDVGINRVADASAPKGARLVGDVAYAKALEVAGAVTPVPGGVGPMTIAWLMRNCIFACEAKN